MASSERTPRTFVYQSHYPLFMTPDDQDVTELMCAAIALRDAWRDDKQVYSVHVMIAFGELIAAIERTIDFEGEQHGSDEGTTDHRHVDGGEQGQESERDDGDPA